MEEMGAIFARSKNLMILIQSSICKKTLCLGVVAAVGIFIWNLAFLLMLDPLGAIDFIVFKYFGFLPAVYAGWPWSSLLLPREKFDNDRSFFAYFIITEWCSVRAGCWNHFAQFSFVRSKLA